MGTFHTKITHDYVIVHFHKKLNNKTVRVLKNGWQRWIMEGVMGQLLMFHLILLVIMSNYIILQKKSF